MACCSNFPDCCRRRPMDRRYSRIRPRSSRRGRRPPRRNLSLNSIAMDIAAKEATTKDSTTKDSTTKDLATKDLAMKPPEGGSAAMAAGEAMQPKAANQPAQPLNIIQKTYRAEALARLQRAAI